MTATTTQPPFSRGDRSRPRGPMPRLLRRRPGDPAWVRPALLALLAATAVLYLAGLSGNGWANAFYSAAVQAGAKSWKAFFFGSFDAASFITVDKTPASLWVMELSARVFGLNSWSVLVPQALEGVAAVGVLYATVRRWASPAAGLIAGAALAVTPVATLMFRYNNPDALLVLLLVVAAYALTRALESGQTRWLALTGALLGFGFLTKMLQAFLVLPVFTLVYLVAGPPRLGERIWQLLVAGAALVAAAGWWVAIVMLTPAANRPYVGGSTTNNILQLTFGYNGLGRLNGNETGSVGPTTRGGAAFGGSPGLTRLLSSDMGGQIGWLLPAALIGLVALLWLTRRAPRTDRTRSAALMWGGWLVLTGLVFSYMSGIIHPYYTVALAPAVGALTGIAGVRLWQIRDSLGARLTLTVILGVTAAWAWVLLGRTPGWLPWLRAVVVLAALAAAGFIQYGRAVRGQHAGDRGLAALALAGPGHRFLAAAPVSLAMVAGLAGPLAYSVSTAATAHSGAIPIAGPSVAGGLGGPGGFPGPGAQPGAGHFPGGAGGHGFRGGRPGGGGFGGGLGRSTLVGSALTTLLKNGAAGYTWVAATVGAESAAPLQLASGDPVMAIGGFNGTDPTPSLAQFGKLVSEHKIHYFVGRNQSSFGGGTGEAAQITAWVAKHFTSQTVSGITVYNLASPLSP
ncbi:MAG TPA: glycosyltransferase family 39 protein [Streptosporangiaceae bacterium]|nr:glycosyltransferase family 39 protein [Streptosporangiaceae bacterium]